MKKKITLVSRHKLEQPYLEEDFLVYKLPGWELNQTLTHEHVFAFFDDKQTHMPGGGYLAIYVRHSNDINSSYVKDKITYLPYFNPAGYTRHKLIKKLKTLVTFL